MRNYKLTFDMNTHIRNFNKKKEADYFIQNNFKLKNNFTTNKKIKQS